MKEKILFIVNPISGHHDKSKFPSIVEKLIDKDKYEYTITLTEYGGHAVELTPCPPKLRRSEGGCLLRKEVIQPLVPQRLPCYDFIPITTHTLDGSPLADGPPASGADGFHDVTGGVYKARERIHGTNC